MNRISPGQMKKRKKVNQMSLQELKDKIEKLEIVNNGSAYLKHLEDALQRATSRNFNSKMKG